MRKFKFSSLALFGAIALSAASCGSPSSGGGDGKKGPMVFWHNFGVNYTSDVNEALINPLASENLIVEAESKKGYDNLLKETPQHLAHTVNRFAVIEVSFPLKLGQQVRCPLNRTCHQLRKETDIGKESYRVMSGK